MTLEEAKDLLKDTVRREFQDHAFGDREISWMRNGKEIACGYASEHSAFCFDDSVSSEQFTQRQIHELFQCGFPGDTYTDNKCVPGLTSVGVRKKITYKAEADIISFWADERHIGTFGVLSGREREICVEAFVNGLTYGRWDEYDPVAKEVSK